MDAAQFSAWQAAARRWRLAPGDDPNVWQGTIDGAAARLRVTLGATPQIDVAITIGGAEGWRGVFMGPRAQALSDDGRWLTGDPDFDEHVRLVTPDARVQALLELETRAAVIDLVAYDGVVLADGALRLAPWAAERVPAGEVERLLAQLAALAVRLGAITVADAPRRLLELAAHEPFAGVRLRCLALADPAAADVEAAGTEHARLAALVADPKLRGPSRLVALQRLYQLFPAEQNEACAIAALGALGEPAVRVLARAARHVRGDPMALARLLVRGRHAEGLATEVADALLRLAAPLEALLTLIADREYWSLRNVLPRAVDGTLGQRGELLAAYFPGTLRDPDLGPAYIEAFARLGDPRWGPLVATALDSPYENLTEVTIATLARIGDLTCVAALKPYTEGFFRSGRTKDAARAAIAAIRQRHDARDTPGALALAGDEGGLALAPDRDRPMT